MTLREKVLSSQMPTTVKHQKEEEEESGWALLNTRHPSWTTMTAEHVVHRQALPSIIAQKVQITYKLFLLENARSTLEQELISFTNKVRSVLTPVMISNVSWR